MNGILDRLACRGIAVTASYPHGDNFAAGNLRYVRNTLHADRKRRRNRPAAHHALSNGKHVCRFGIRRHRLQPEAFCIQFCLTRRFHCQLVLASLTLDVLLAFALGFDALALPLGLGFLAPPLFVGLALSLGFLLRLALFLGKPVQSFFFGALVLEEFLPLGFDAFLLGDRRLGRRCRLGLLF